MRPCLNDNAGLYHALQSGFPVLSIFIFDTDIILQLEDKQDRRVDLLIRHFHKFIRNWKILEVRYV